MTRDFPGEVWKTVQFNFSYSNDSTVEVSNFGRIRTFNRLSNGNILTGSMVNGYKIIHLKFFTERDIKTRRRLDLLQSQITDFAKKVKLLNVSGGNENELKDAKQLLQGLKKNYNKKIQEDIKKRTINYHALVHRLVAEYFCKRPSDKHTVVGHLDFNKLNNQSNNLKWMTAAENRTHQQKSPFVIEAKKAPRNKLQDHHNAKLTVTKVMLLKKLLNSGKPMRTLVKQFKVTETQILRIKRGENWAGIEAAN